MADKSKMSCNKPVSSDRPGKKKMVKACDNGQEKLIHFGADGYKHNYSAEAKKSFRARHGCDDANDKLSAKYWACKNLWPKNKNNFSEGGVVQEESCGCESCLEKEGIVDGPEIVKGDSEKNDVVKANLSAGEMVIPKTVVEKGPEAIAKFAEEELSRVNMATGGLVEDEDLGFVADDELGFVAEEAPAQQPTSGEILLGGAKQGATLGFADEIGAGIGALLEDLSPNSATNVDAELRKQGFKLPESANYNTLLAEERAQDKALQQASTGEYLAGNVIGGALTLPLTGLNAVKGATAGAKIASAATQGARAGALTGLGTSEAKDAAGLIEDVGTGTAVGGVLGGGVQGVTSGAKALGSAIAEKIPVIPRAYEKGLQGINTTSKAFADKASKSYNEIVDKMVNAVQTTKENINKINKDNIAKVTTQIDDISKDIASEINVTKKLQKGLNEAEKTKLELQKNDLVKNIQQKFGETKNQVSESYDAIESQIPETMQFNIADDLVTLEDDLLKFGKSPQDAVALAQRFVGTQDPSKLSFTQLRQLRADARAYADSPDPAIKKAASNMIKKLNQTRAATLSTQPETQGLVKTLAETDKKYATILDLEDNFLGKVNFDKQTGQAFTKASKENLPNPEAIKTVTNILDPKAQKIAETEELLNIFKNLDPKLKETLQPQIDELLVRGRRIQGFEPNVPSQEEALLANPEAQRLKTLLDQLKTPPEAKTQTDRLLKKDEVDIRDYIKKALPELESPIVAESGISNISKVLDDVKKITGQDLKGQAEETVKDLSLIRDANEVFRRSLNPRSLGLLGSISQKAANVTGRVGKTVKDAGYKVGSTVKSVTTDDVTNIISNLKKFGTPEAEVYARQLSQAADKGPEGRNAVVFSLMQQPQFRQLFNKDEKK